MLFFFCVFCGAFFLWVCLCFPVCVFFIGFFCFFPGNHVWLFVLFFFVLSAVLFFVPVFGSLCFFFVLFAVLFFACLFASLCFFFVLSCFLVA